MKFQYRDPIILFQALANDPFAAFLDSAVVAQGNSCSVIAVDPSHIVSGKGAAISVDGHTVEGDPFTVVERLLGDTRGPPSPDVPSKFQGGAVGYFGYELASHLEKLPIPRASSLDIPDIVVGIYETVALFNCATQEAWIVSHADKAEAAARALLDRLESGPCTLQPLGARPPTLWKSDFSRNEVEKRIQKIIDYIVAGDIFQANFTQRFRAERPKDVSDFEIYRHLRALSPALFSAFLRCGDVSIASASPERFLSLDAQRNVSAVPLKGTRPRGRSVAADDEYRSELALSLKDRAENLMIVDLMRNDLSRIAELGSVRVSRLCEAQTFPSLHHLVSQIDAQLKLEFTAIDLLRATFPGGSITGAPKVRAMEIIHELEFGPRGAYCGCLGWIGFDGAMDMSMTIRTLTLTPEVVVAQAGGGIVADSVPSSEYDESMTKIEPLLRALNGRENEDDDALVQRIFATGRRARC